MKRFWLIGLLAALTFAAPTAHADDVSNGSWSTTDGSNNAAPPNGWPAGMFPNQVEPSARSNMGGIKRWWERANAGISTTGSTGAYVLTPTNASYPTAYTQGEIICAKANFTSVGNDTLNVNSLGAKPLYVGLAPIAAGVVQSGQQFCAAYDGSLNAGAGGFQIVAGVAISTGVPTRHVITASGTYSTPAGTRQLRVRMVGGGGGGGSGGSDPSAGTNGGTGGDTIFNSIRAAGGVGGFGGNSHGNVYGGQGGAGGSGAASFRSSGGGGGAGLFGPSTNANGAPGGAGGSSVLGGGGPGAGSGNGITPGYGGGGGGGDTGNQNWNSGGGGGGGEYAEVTINNPASSYSVTIGSAGSAGSTARVGNPGGQGVIIVDEYP